MKRTRRNLVVVAMLIIFSLCAAACTSSDDTTTPDIAQIEQATAIEVEDATEVEDPVAVEDLIAGADPTEVEDPVAVEDPTEVEESTGGDYPTDFDDVSPLDVRDWLQSEDNNFVSQLICFEVENPSQICGAEQPFAISPTCRHTDAETGAETVVVRGSYIFGKQAWDDALGSNGELKSLVADRSVVIQQADVERDGGDPLNFIAVAGQSQAAIIELTNAFENSTEAFENIVYFLNQGTLNFRPEGTPPQAIDANNPAFPPVFDATIATRSPTSVWVVDTGVLTTDSREDTDGITADVHYSETSKEADGNDDPLTDVYTGHGGVIADMVGDLLGASNSNNSRDVHLQRVLTERSIIGTHATNDDRTTRGFDTTALLATLNTVPTTAGVINMSLSAVGCPEQYPENHPLVRWIERLPASTTVVAAAGNDATNLSHYPAAFSDYEDSAVANRVISIGAVTASGHYTCFTNYHESIDAYLLGERLQVDHPMHGEVAWLGTSFAAPQAAAMVAAGATKQSLSTKYGSPKPVNCPS